MNIVSEYWWLILIGFVSGIIAGRTTTSYRLFKADELVREAGELLKRTKAYRDEMEGFLNELKAKGCDIRENDRSQD